MMSRIAKLWRSIFRAQESAHHKNDVDALGMQEQIEPIILIKEPVNPVEHMLIGDWAVGADGKRYLYYSVHYPCERHVALRSESGDFIQLSMSEAKRFLTPDENRAEGLYEFSLPAPKTSA